ncbi:MAG: hypothetical protein GF335_01675 [Candidatus Moranbacteria bacterium]|nr:hypothetical protein [Candidatus Moranbacteria bacterium]
MDKQDQLFNQLQDIILQGDEYKVKKFVLENFNDFPKDFQKEIAVSLFKDGLDNVIADKFKEFEIKRRNLQIMIDAAREELEKAKEEEETQ